MDGDRNRILIVDDDRTSRRIFEINLTSMGHDTVMVNNGEEALEYLAGDADFDLIITDVMMPYMTGFDLAKKLRGYAETKDIPLIATSAFHDWKKAMAEHALDVDGFIPKPVERDVLIREIRRVLGG